MTAVLAPWGDSVTTDVQVGSVVKIDSWRISQVLESSDWEAAAFRIPTTNGVIRSLAVNVTVTGRTLQRLSGGGLWVRVRVEFVGDGEPSTYAGGWLLIERGW